MCEYCDLDEWVKNNPPPEIPDPTWNVKFLDVQQAMSSRPKGVSQKRHYARRYIDVQIIAPSRFVAERVAWDVLKEKIGRVPFKDDFVLMGSSEMCNAK